MELILSFLPSFLLVFCRITSFIVVAPIFSTRMIPTQFKIGFGAFLSLLTLLSLPDQRSVLFDSIFVIMVLRELLIGLLIGFIAYLFFTIVQVSGQFIDLQMGFGLANVIDPMSGQQSPLLSNLKFMVATLLFLAMNGHHYMLKGIMDSYKYVPLQNKLFESIASGSISTFLMMAVSKMFALAFQMAMPLVVTMFLVDVAMGILAKTAPQFNLFVIGLPTKILLGLFMLVLLMPSLAYLFRNLFEMMFASMDELLRIIERGAEAVP